MSSRSWVWLGDTEDLREPGDFITGRIGYQSVVVVRQEDGSIAGYLNNCRHRASGLCFDAAGNTGKHFTCPYHNWSYALDGRLVTVPDEERMYPTGFDRADFGLVPIRVFVVWDKLVFGCLSHKAPPFREWIAPVVDRYDRYRHRDAPTASTGSSTRSTRSTGKRSARTPTTTTTCASSTGASTATRKQMDTIVRFAGRTTSGYKPHADHVRPVGRPARPRRDGPQGSLRGVRLPEPHAAAVSDATDPGGADPLAPDCTRLFSRIYGLTDDVAEQEAQLTNLEQTNDEDTSMVTVLMGNLRSPFYRVGPPTTWEGRAAYLMRLVRDDVATPLAPDEFTAPIPADPDPSGPTPAERQ